MKQLIAITCLLMAPGLARADGPADNIPSAVRQVPPPGIEVPVPDRARLETGLTELAQAIDGLRQSDNAPAVRYLPDVEIFHRAVDQALRFDEMFSKGDINKADELLAEGLKRVEHLAKDEPYWTTQRGLVVRGFRSKLDDTVQPYGLVIPPTYRSDIPYRYRTDLWFHGRGERSVELQFIHQQMHNPGQYQPEDTIVLHPFGRYSNAFKFAGEVDVLEALDHAKANYRIDDDLISVRGFSMGGAGAWHFAVHYPDLWFAANPGAGFSETPQFLQTFQGEMLQPTWWEKQLWSWYDCVDGTTNLTNLPVIAYSGEIDRQRQAADIMADAFGDLPQLQHIIGLQTAHKIHPESKVEIEQRLQQIARLPREIPRLVRLSTNSVKYNRMHWLTLNRLPNNWLSYGPLVEASFNARAKSPIGTQFENFPQAVVTVRSMGGVDDLMLKFPSGTFDPASSIKVEMIVFHGDYFDQHFIEDEFPPIKSDGSWFCRLFAHPAKEWHIGTPPWEGQLMKRHGLQGPIDDALMDSFVFVKPSGECRHSLVQEWTTSEFERAVKEWRRQMRGDVRVRADVDLTEEDIANHNLILWGDPTSNSVMRQIADQLPIQWGEDQITVGERTFDAAHHAPILIYPNPLNPKKYVVFNSSFTYREYDYLNNARQTPKLPDWAVIDLRVKPDSRWPGKIADADFFDEQWQLQKPYRERMAE